MDALHGKEKIEFNLKPVPDVSFFSCTFLNLLIDTPSDLGIGIDLKSADKELKAVTPKNSKTCVIAFTKRLVTTFQQLSRTKNGHFFLK